MKVTTFDLVSAKTENGEGLGSCDLADEAAMAAAMILAGNWEDAIAEGETVEQLSTDIGDVICMLQAWRNALRHTFE